MGEFAVVERSHFPIVADVSGGNVPTEVQYTPPNLDKDGLNAAVPIPMHEYRQLGGVDLAFHLTDEGKVYARDELYDGRLIWVVIATGDLETVNTVLVDGLFGENNAYGEWR